MRVCDWCHEETPLIPGALWGTVALCQACLPEVQAILQAHAWDSTDEGESPHA